MILASVFLEYGVTILWVSLIIILCVILYKRLLKKWQKNQPNTADFVTLYALENPISKGNVDFLFEQQIPKHVHFSIEDKLGKQLVVLHDEESKKGQHILKFDTTTLPDGNYFFVLKTDNQSTSKLMRIRNGNQ